VQPTLKVGKRQDQTLKLARLRQALDATLNLDKLRTGDLGCKATSSDFTQALVSHIANG
jgi:isocitrate dehydrogenase (NAD+)